MTEIDRWRLVLGRYAQPQLGAPQEGSPIERQAQALDFLYGRAYAGRGVLDADGGGQQPGGGPGPGGGDLGPGGGDQSDPRVTHWLGEIHDLFPPDVSEVIVHHALERFGLTEVMADPRVLRDVTPSPELLALLLTLRRTLPAAVDAQLRRMVTEVVDELRRRLEPEVRRVLAGARRGYTHSPLPVAANFDVQGTIRRNLKNYDPNRRRLVTTDLRFFDRHARRLSWDVIICIDQSGSMAESVIHSAVLAAILAGLPNLRTALIVFDTSIIDLSAHADDPITVLMSVQLGGGTDIGQAVRYATTLVENPTRTIVVLITDFCEGGPPSELVRAVGALVEGGVRTLGLASLAEQSPGRPVPHYDRAMAQRLADEGMEIAACTPRQLADWLVEATS
ncbi:VWA domain-containing protein [Gordonia sp. ABSL1-1]|uniref:VWA domain-containing protein n=1 Tax=Gordonia sp. ABSL1-1 TaxID=3053923 RepID=UPI002572A137|nr:VWA domain-containing protein [Gordonia sp. ABSL1-1]MDL9936587.1 VWA domain-containing protein [Gordonia sp. ABSL1-1]